MKVRKRKKRFSGDMEVMRGIIALDPELERREYWIARFRAGGLRRVLKTLVWMAVIGLGVIGLVRLVLRLAKLG